VRDVRDHAVGAHTDPMLRMTHPVEPTGPVGSGAIPRVWKMPGRLSQPNGLADGRETHRLGVKTAKEASG